MKELNFLNDLVDCFEKLPGVGRKTATRYAYYVIENYSLEEVKNTCSIIVDTVKNIHKCPNCGMYTSEDICEICEDSTRNQQQLMVVKDPKDLISIEKSGQYDGLYHVLGGLISGYNGLQFNENNLDLLEQKVKNNNIDEVILAIPLTPNGEVTSRFIEKLLSKYNVKISRIGYGLPAGSDLEYADEMTIRRALEYRISTKE